MLFKFVKKVRNKNYNFLIQKLLIGEILNLSPLYVLVYYNNV